MVTLIIIMIIKIIVRLVADKTPFFFQFLVRAFAILERVKIVEEEKFIIAIFGCFETIGLLFS